MGLKYSLPTGEVVELDFDDILDIDFTTTQGKQVMQAIMENKDFVKIWKDFDEAEVNDSLKYIDKEDLPPPKDKSFEDFEIELYNETLKEKLGEG